MHMDDDFIQNLLFAESDFLTTLKGGTEMLASYNQKWSFLPDVLRAASKAGSVGEETLCLAHSIASRVASLASCVLDIRRAEDSFTISLQKDWDAILHQMAAIDLSANSKTQLSDNGSNTLLSCSHSSISISNEDSPFLASAHQWLLGNLHNPYPTAEIKARMAAASSCRVSSINSWFANARRRIGWTTLCREHFSSCRVDMIDAAYRALVEEDPRRMLSPELRHSFVAMKVVAEGLFPSTLTKGAFSKDLDSVLKDMVEKGSESAGVGKRRQVGKANPTEVRETEVWGSSRVSERENLQAAQDSYPSPDPSITASPVPALNDALTDEREEDVGHLINAGLKRRRPSIDPVNEPSSTDIRPIKRLRASITSRMCLPSPPSSTDDIDGPLDDGSPEVSLVHSTLPETNELLPSRKRHLSDTGATAIPNRPRDLLASAPCPHTVPDPLSRPNIEDEHSIDDWFSTNFDDLFVIPPPVEATEPEFSASWEVELFKDYSVPRNPKYTSECSPAHTHMPMPSDLSELNDLLQSLGNDARVTPSDSVLPPSMTGPADMVSHDSLVPDISQTIIDWTSFLNDTTYQPIVYPAFSRYPADFQPLPEIDLSMLQLPQVMPAVDPQDDFPSKQAKLHQLHTMREAVRRMEQELRSEGVVM